MLMVVTRWLRFGLMFSAFADRKIPHAASATCSGNKPHLPETSDRDSARQAIEPMWFGPFATEIDPLVVGQLGEWLPYSKCGGRWRSRWLLTMGTIGKSTARRSIITVLPVDLGR
jgi:hypothetical protein